MRLPHPPMEKEILIMVQLVDMLFENFIVYMRNKNAKKE